MSPRRAIPLLFALASLLCVFAAPAQAGRELLGETFLETDPTAKPPTPPQEGQIEGACGLAAIPGGGLYVSDYYHGYVDRFSAEGTFQSQTSVGLHPEGPCGLALDSTGRLYANLWHQSALRLPPDDFGFVPGHVTGIAVDPATDYLYLDHHNLEHHSYVSVYLPSGAAAEQGGHPIDIGLGSLGDAYGVAAFEGRVYVADATDEQVKVYEPAVDPDQPAFTIGGFNSLIDAALAIDPTNGHLLALDNTQPGYEHPIAAVYEFTATGAALGRLSGKPVWGKPSGIAVDPLSGALFVTDGNSEESNVFAYGPYQEGVLPLTAPQPPVAAATVAATGTSAAAVVTEPKAIAAPPRRVHRNHKRRRHHRRHHARVGGRG